MYFSGELCQSLFISPSLPVSGGCAYCEVVISGRREGPFSTQLQCSIEHGDTPLLLPLEGCIQVRRLVLMWNVLSNTPWFRVGCFATCIVYLSLPSSLSLTSVLASSLSSSLPPSSSPFFPPHFLLLPSSLTPPPSILHCPPSPSYLPPSPPLLLFLPFSLPFLPALPFLPPLSLSRPPSLPSPPSSLPSLFPPSSLPSLPSLPLPSSPYSLPLPPFPSLPSPPSSPPSSPFSSFSFSFLSPSLFPLPLFNRAQYWM